jgi:hypothetical protein
MMANETPASDIVFIKFRRFSKSLICKWEMLSVLE